MKHNESRRKVCIGIISVILLLLIFAYSRSRNRVFINWEDIAGTGSGNSEATVQEAENSRTDPEEERIQRMRELVREFDFTVPEQSINAEVYNAETDRKYKEAFLKVLFNRGILSDETMEYTFKNHVQMNGWQDEAYINTMVNKAKYWYMDADGDGMLELVIDTAAGNLVNTLRILKYDTEKDCAELFFSGGGNSWCFMCSGSLYYCNPTGDGTRYGLCRYDLQGNLTLAFDFQQFTPAV